MEEKILTDDEKRQRREDRKKRRKYRLLILLLLLLGTGTMLVTSTYAWFTSNRTVTVEDIDVNVAASGGIQVSVDGTNWKSIITNAKKHTNKKYVLNIDLKYFFPSITFNRIVGFFKTLLAAS